MEQKEKILRDNAIDQQFMDYLDKLDYSIIMDEEDDDSEKALRALRQLQMESRVIRQRWTEPGKLR